LGIWLHLPDTRVMQRAALCFAALAAAVVLFLLIQTADEQYMFQSLLTSFIFRHAPT